MARSWQGSGARGLVPGTIHRLNRHAHKDRLRAVLLRVREPRAVLARHTRMRLSSAGAVSTLVLAVVAGAAGGAIALSAAHGSAPAVAPLSSTQVAEVVPTAEQTEMAQCQVGADESGGTCAWEADTQEAILTPAKAAPAASPAPVVSAAPVVVRHRTVASKPIVPGPVSSVPGVASGVDTGPVAAPTGGTAGVSTHSDAPLPTKYAPEPTAPCLNGVGMGSRCA